MNVVMIPIIIAGNTSIPFFQYFTLKSFLSLSLIRTAIKPPILVKRRAIIAMDTTPKKIRYPLYMLFGNGPANINNKRKTSVTIPKYDPYKILFLFDRYDAIKPPNIIIMK